MMKSHSTLILISVFSIIVQTSQEPPSCCGKESALLEYEKSFKCENAQRIMLPCNTSDIYILNRGHSEFAYQTDGDGETMYVERYGVVHSPK